MSYSAYFENAVIAGRNIAGLAPTVINQVLLDVAESAVEQTDLLLAENQKDLDRMNKTDPKYDRLKLTTERIAGIATEIRNVAGLESPLGEVLSADTLPNGLKLSKVRVPLGVVGVIYEARPNVTFDVFSLCFKTGNVSVLKGGSDADFSNQAIISVIHNVLKKHNIDINAATLLPAEREATEALLNAVGSVDVLIPRGSQGLINFVRQHSKIPVIETGAGIVHTYFDEDGDLEKGSAIIFNAKTRRVSVCNALDCLIINSNRLPDLPKLIQQLGGASVEVFADEASYQALSGQYPAQLLQQATEEHFGTEFLSMKMAIKTVDDFDAALHHIAQHSSKHSEAIISQNPQHMEDFLNKVDAAAVYVNASTAFTDGAQFGLGAEIGISTQKLHARGPMGLKELTSYKWLVKGDGQVRT
ncbi:glutamate-5-semialdehyde dehydrogenase [Mucilaginibacter polytrichastri]|uniref:Gamma-glutamyl phosphate reductase n=1 Tax=Mucilaginibacter polytrichastri TaxID=1302689 RepID=A0A1Q5ZUZ5_9SPHI|nr:glutamate-5-semialdehyde dehydrogenase [Mucilaginibacter polytrichastri]OKS85602.1 Gamma-glutamyl phosphate reductase [Mucilaginibacter polytrichastri]SFS35873.1 glutamate-5-semialdehyde dehydrogenase [Mucilaginibacter polytrichastri]